MGCAFRFLCVYTSDTHGYSRAVFLHSGGRLALGAIDYVDNKVLSSSSLLPAPMMYPQAFEDGIDFNLQLTLLAHVDQYLERLEYRSSLKSCDEISTWYMRLVNYH